MNETDYGLMFFGNSVAAETTLEELEAYLTVVDKFLKKTASSRAYKARALSLESNSDNDFDEVFPDILYSSFITAVVSFFERELRDFTDCLREASSSSIGVGDLSGSWLERFRKYCEKVAHLSLAVDKIEWENIRSVIEVRNCVVHTGGSLFDFQGRATIEAFVRRHKLVLSEFGLLNADLKLSRCVLEIVKKFIEYIYKAADNKYPHRPSPKFLSL